MPPSIGVPYPCPNAEVPWRRDPHDYVSGVQPPPHTRHRVGRPGEMPVCVDCGSVYVWTLWARFPALSILMHRTGFTGPCTRTCGKASRH